MHACQTVPNELFRDMCEPVALALRALLGGECRPLSDAIECTPRPVGHASVELTVGVFVKGATGRIRCVFRDPRHLERLAVVERRVPAAMMHDNWVFGRHLIEIVRVEWSLVLELRVVVEVALDPHARGKLTSLCPKLL